MSDNKTESMLNAIPRHSRTGDVLPNTGGWMTRHFDALSRYCVVTGSRALENRPSKEAHERAIALMLQGWLAYADAHRNMFGTDPETCLECDGRKTVTKFTSDELEISVPCGQCNGTGIICDGLIGRDGVLGPEWLSIGKALRALLNGEAGRLDCGTVDGVILKALGENGIDLEEEGL